MYRKVQFSSRHVKLLVCVCVCPASPFRLFVLLSRFSLSVSLVLVSLRTLPCMFPFFYIAHVFSLSSAAISLLVPPRSYYFAS